MTKYCTNKMLIFGVKIQIGISLRSHFCKTRNIRKNFTQPFFITTKFEGFILFFGLQIFFSFQNSYNKVGITRHKYTHFSKCVRYIKHTFFLHQKGVCFFLLLIVLKKSNKSKNRPFFLRSSGLSC